MLKIIFPKINIKIERWKWNEEYQVYVSTFGNLKDVNKKDIALSTTLTGYLNVKTPRGYKLVHRIVMQTFKPTEGMEKLTVDHLNHNKRDNSLANLEWVTKEINQERAIWDIVGITVNIDGVPAIFGKQVLIDNKSFTSIEAAGRYIKHFIAKEPAMKNETAEHYIKNCIRTGKDYKGHIIKLVWGRNW